MGTSWTIARPWSVMMTSPPASAIVTNSANDFEASVTFTRMIPFVSDFASSKSIQTKASSSNSSARFANARMFPTRSALPVSSVIAFATGPAIAMQECPAASP
jgi:hypothetical protein